MKKFALIGAAGYVAPRHMAAIKHVGGDLVAALDPHDSVGVLDGHFPDCAFFTEFERFDRHCSKRGDIDYVVVCSPNYLHDSHCRFGLRIGANVICEKPVVLHERNLDELMKIERETGKAVHPILQMRLHPEALKAWQYVYWSSDARERHRLEVDYVVQRGRWYDYSWKGDVAKSGGVETNIGIHLFDMCAFLLGRLTAYNCLLRPNKRTIVGQLFFEKDIVNFHLSTNGYKPHRSFTIDGVEYDFSGKSFENLHNTSYDKIVSGSGFTLDDTREAVRICEKVRTC